MSMNVGQLIACLHEFNPSTPVAAYLHEVEEGGVATGKISLETRVAYEDGDDELYYKGDSPFEFIQDDELVTIHFAL
jgi:hypothetical protein